MEWETLSLQGKGSSEVWRAKCSFPEELVGQKAQDSGSSILNLSWSDLLQERALGLRASVKHSELLEHLLPSPLPICAHGECLTIELKLQLQSRLCLGYFFFFSCNIKCSLFLIMGSPARKTIGSKIASCEWPKASANFYNSFDRKIKRSDLFPNIHYWEIYLERMKR